MKFKVFSFIIILNAVFLYHSKAQNPAVDSPEYQIQKINGTLNIPLPINNQVDFTIDYLNAPFPQIQNQTLEVPESSSCGCYIEPDATHILAMGPNDDGSTSSLPLQFNFCLYGQNWNSYFINNNGNISFGTPFGTFSSVAFPTTNFTMVAPFWGDVDTRPAGNGQVFYKNTPTHTIVTWKEVGYFNQQQDKRNTFQVIITDGTDPILPPGQNVAFCYKDMQWTTGSASQGVNGFGGIPATVGANRGNGIDFLQLGRFNQPGNVYDGPFGNPDGIDWLDFKSFYFNTCNSSNIPPILNSDITCDTLLVCVGDVVANSIEFLSPENGQITSITVNQFPANFVVNSNVSGNLAVLSYTFTPDASNVGFNTVSVTATDNGTPVGTSTYSFVIQVSENVPVAQISGQNEVCQGTTIVLDAGPGFTSYQWSNGSSSQTINAGSGVYTVTVEIDGCFATSPPFQVITNPSPVYSIVGPNVFCEGDSIILSTNPTGFAQYNWSTGATTPQIYVSSPGLYNVTVIDSNGCQGATFAIQVNMFDANTEILGVEDFCEGQSIQISALGDNFVSYLWNTGETTQSITATGGLYSIEALTAQGCTATASVNLIPLKVPTVGFSPLVICVADTVFFQNSTTVDGSNGAEIEIYTWNFGDNSPNSNDENPEHIYTNTGTFEVILQAQTNQGCSAQISQLFKVNDIPNPNFTYEAKCFQEVLFFNTSTPGQDAAIESYLYNFNNEGTSSELNPTFVFKQDGFADVTLLVTDANGCSNTVIIPVLVEEGVSWDDFPNIITPNGDGINDVLELNPDLDVCFEYTLTFFNRWGQKVFETNSTQNPFKGETNSGRKLSDGVYFYVLRSSGNIEKTGSITVISSTSN